MRNIDNIKRHHRQNIKDLRDILFGSDVTRIFPDGSTDMQPATYYETLPDKQKHYGRLRQDLRGARR